MLLRFERIDVRAVAEEGRDLARELARRSVVLACNTGILPLASGDLEVAVIGPHADAVARSSRPTRSRHSAR